MPASDSRHLRSGLFIFGLVLLAGALTVGGWYRFTGRRLEIDRSELLDKAASQPRQLPSPRPDNYVGSQACNACHSEIAASYARHPMGRSIRPVGPEDAAGSASAAVANDRERSYSIEFTTDGTLLHHERVADEDGKTLYDQAVAVAYALGSGRRGRAYLIDGGGALYQSPIGWYSHRQCWDLSPGYRTTRSVRFSREIDGSCLYCHVGRLSTEWPQTVTDKPFQEMAIGCERCHGPGQQHVTLMQRLGPEERAEDVAIVNPGRLDSAHREAVCNQCHLSGKAVFPRYGRGFFDFRPGDLLSDSLVVLDDTDRATNARAVSQVEQMRSSKCFQDSNESLGCISCHDPHSTPTPLESAAFYRSRCLTCHGEDDCELPPPTRHQEAANSCIACHMPAESVSDVPHTALTDHRIRRWPDRPEATGTPQQTAHLGVFPEGGGHLPDWEINRARGLWLAETAVRSGDQQLAHRAIDLLLPGLGTARPATDPLATIRTDIPVLLAVGQVFTAGQADQMAAQAYEAVLDIDPKNATALSELARLAQHRGDRTAALAFLKQLETSRPTSDEIPARQAALLAASGKPSEAVDAARRSLVYNPTRIPLRRWLVQVLKAQGQTSEAAREADWLTAYQAAIDRASKGSVAHQPADEVPPP